MRPYLSPDVLEHLAVTRDPPSVSVNELIDATYMPWAKQMELVFGGAAITAHTTSIYPT
jgi:hypothetical protein